MKKAVSFAINYIIEMMRKNRVSSENIRNYLKEKKFFTDNKVLSAGEINKVIYNMIQSPEPFFVGRFGATELSAIKTFDFEIEKNYEKILEQMQMWSGFFPTTEENGKRFLSLMLEVIPEIDVMGIWLQPFEEYYIHKYANPKIKMAYLLDIEPWSSPDFPWTKALIDKKVLVIHPFAETIRNQYEKREKLFRGTEILPEFELKTLKAVQTIAGQKDERFENWFEALNWMYEEALKIDFEIAIIGCGAYGFPLAAKLKKAGKKAIHLAGATQLLFGIKGKRWENNNTFSYINRFFNEDWVYPKQKEVPEKAQNVENGCYW